MNRLSTLGLEPSLGELLAAALANGALTDPTGTSRDLTALLARFRTADAGAVAAAVSETQQSLAANTVALQLLEVINQDSGAGDPDLLSFGPIRQADPGAVERLAMLTQVGFSSDRFLTFFSNGAADFVLSSGGGTPPVMQIASLVQARLGSSTLNALRWRDEVIPHLLQVSFELRDLVVAGTGGALPAEWTETEQFLTPWVASRATLRPDPLDGDQDDGFLTGNRPGAIHPLVLRILRPKVQNMLSSNDSGVVDEATAFNAFLADAAVATDAAVAASPALFPPAPTPGCAFAAGAFILTSARTRGVILGQDGTIQTSAGAEPLGALVDRTLNALIFGCESDQQVLPPAWTDKAQLEDLLGACPDWVVATSSTGFGTPLRGRAQARLAAALSDLGGVLSAQATKVPSDQLLPEAEQVALLEARPETAQNRVVAAVDEAASALKTVKSMSEAAAGARRVFEGRLASPIAEPTLVNLLPVPGSEGPVDVTDGGIATYLTSKIARLAPEPLARALEGTGSWATAVNQAGASIADLLPSWVPLELWDGLRGRLMRPANVGEVHWSTVLVRTCRTGCGGPQPRHQRRASIWMDSGPPWPPFPSWACPWPLIPISLTRSLSWHCSSGSRNCSTRTRGLVPASARCSPPPRSS